MTKPKYTPTTSLDDYSKLCKGFFLRSPYNDADLPERILEMTEAQYNKFTLDMFDGYDKCRDVLVEIVRGIRGDYNFVWTDKKDPHDPAVEPENADVIKAYKQVLDGALEGFMESIKEFEIKRLSLSSEREALEIEKRKNITVQGTKYKAIGMCDVLYSGWECDSTAWVVQTPEGAKLVGSNHGSLYFVEEDYLLERISAYNKATKESLELLELLK